MVKLQFGDSEYFTVAERSTDSPHESPVVLLKEFSGFKQDDRIRFIQQQTQCEHFVKIRDIFLDESLCFFAFEFMPLSIADIMGNPLMNELRLASILGQVRGTFLRRSS
ncbi:hypothetical protein V2G26_021298 [Clonostachys chloroleuca]